MMDAITQITYLYMLALLMALVIERVMEILNASWNYVEWQFDLHEFWTRRAKKLQARFEALASSRLWNKFLDLTGLLFQIRKKLADNKAGHSGKIPIISGDLVRNAALVVANRIAAAIMGVLFCWTTQINLIAIFNSQLKLDYKIITQMPVWLALVLSGIFLGMGAEPVHHMIQMIEKRRKK